MDKVAAIKRLYMKTTRASIAKDIEQAIGLLKAMESEEDRERAAVYMDGLSQMRSEWGLAPKPAAEATTRRAPSISVKTTAKRKTAGR